MTETSTAILANLNSDMAGVVDQARQSLVQIRNGRRGVGAGVVWSKNGIMSGPSVGLAIPTHVIKQFLREAGIYAVGIESGTLMTS